MKKFLVMITAFCILAATSFASSPPGENAQKDFNQWVKSSTKTETISVASYSSFSSLIDVRAVDQNVNQVHAIFYSKEGSTSVADEAVTPNKVARLTHNRSWQTHHSTHNKLNSRQHKRKPLKKDRTMIPYSMCGWI